MSKVDKTVKKLVKNFQNQLNKIGKSEKAKIDKTSDGDLTLTAETKARLKNDIRKAQRRLRSAPQFSKELAKSRGVKLTTKSDDKSLIRNASLANYINDNEIFTKRGYNGFIRELSSELRLSTKEMDFIFSQIDVETMDFISNSKLRYGSNPQLDFAFDEATSIAKSFEETVRNINRFEFDIEDFYDELF